MTGINYLHTLAALALLQRFSPRYFLHYNVYLHKIYVSSRSRRFTNSQLEKSKREHEKLVDLILLPFTIPITRLSAASKPCKVAVTERLSTSSCMSHELPCLLSPSLFKRIMQPRQRRFGVSNGVKLHA